MSSSTPNATPSNIDTHAGHHGGWTYHDGSTQYFFDHYCGAMDGQDASNAAYDPGGRYHMRYFWQYDSFWGTYATVMPHHEETSFSCGHAVDDNNGQSGGFVMGKVDIGRNWHNWNGQYGGSPGPHTFGGSTWWGNTDPQVQCNGNIASNDGWVDFVEIQ